MSNRQRVAELAGEHLRANDPTGWFEALYAASNRRAEEIPWADLRPGTLLERWLAQQAGWLRGCRALVVGCGLGDDAEALAALGCQVTAFDIAPTAIAWARERFPQTNVHYQVADLFALPAEWQRSFDFVLERYTLQALPEDVRAAGPAAIAKTLAPGGRALVICRLREQHEPASGPPWPLCRDELELFTAAGLQTESWEEVYDEEDPPVRRAVAVYRRA